MIFSVFLSDAPPSFSPDRLLSVNLELTDLPLRICLFLCPHHSPGHLNSGPHTFVAGSSLSDLLPQPSCALRQGLCNRLNKNAAGSLSATVAEMLQVTEWRQWAAGPRGSPRQGLA